MPRGSSELRLFVAAYPPVDVAAEMVAAARRLVLPRHRETPLEQIHLTILFIGRRQARELDGVIESIERSASGIEPFELTPSRLIALPNRGERRLIALQADAPAALLELRSRLVTRLAASRREAATAFHPHLTLLRFKPPVSFRLPEEETVVAMPAMGVERIHLMRSVMTPHGAEHAPIVEVPLA